MCESSRFGGESSNFGGESFDGFDVEGSRFGGEAFDDGVSSRFDGDRSCCGDG